MLLELALTPTVDRLSIAYVVNHIVVTELYIVDSYIIKSCSLTVRFY